MIAFALLLAIQSHPADDYISLSAFDGGQFIAECEKDRGLQSDACTVYILGVADALQLNRITCRPASDAATLQTVTIVRRYIKAHPEQWNRAPVWLVSEPLRAAFPCRRAQ